LPTVSTPAPAAIARHPHLAEPLPAGWVRVDMHSHTMWSGDSTTTPDEIVEAVAESGLDVLCITDHHSIRGAQQLAPRLAALGCRVIVGEELRTHHGEIIGLFLRERLPHGMASAEAAAAVRAQGGLVYVPHPFDPTKHNLAEQALAALVGDGLVDAVEVLNAKTALPGLDARAAAFAADHDLAPGAGSDAHVPDALGAAFMVMPDFDGPQEMLHSLRIGQSVGHHWDEHRPWRPRILPSLTAE